MKASGATNTRGCNNFFFCKKSLFTVAKTHDLSITAAVARFSAGSGVINATVESKSTG